MWRLFLQLLLILSFVPACFPAGEEEGQALIPKRNRNRDTGQTEYLDTLRWTRRLSLDMLGRLPTTDELTEVSNAEERIPALISSYSNSTQYAQHFSGMHEMIWQLDIDRLSDFSRFINAGDAALDTALTDSVRWEVLNDPLLQIKLNIDLDQPYYNLFRSNFSLGTSDLFTFWGFGSTAPAYLGTDLLYGIYADSRPTGGLLSNQGFLALFDSEEEPIPYTRTYSIFKKLSCIDAYNDEIHNFEDLDESDLDGNLRDYAANNKICAGCHRSHDEMAVLFSGLASGETFGAYSSYSAATGAQTTRYLGREVANLDELASLAGINPAVHRCHIRRVMETFLQRRFNADVDTSTLNILHNTFVSNGYKISSVLRTLSETDLYRVSSFIKSTSSKQAKLLTGSRYLNRNHWAGIVEQFGFNPDDYNLSPALNPSQYEWNDRRTFFPQGPYYHAHKIVSYQFSSAVIIDELANNTTSESRTIFTVLADNFYETTEEDDIRQQIADLLLVFTAQQLEITDNKVDDLYDLWDEVRGADTAGEHRQAWLIVLRAIFLSNDFLVY